jgi:hypothetical protein
MLQLWSVFSQQECLPLCFTNQVGTALHKVSAFELYQNGSLAGTLITTAITTGV